MRSEATTSQKWSPCDFPTTLCMLSCGYSLHIDGAMVSKNVHCFCLETALFGKFFGHMCKEKICVPAIPSGGWLYAVRRNFFPPPPWPPGINSNHPDSTTTIGGALGIKSNHPDSAATIGGAPGINSNHPQPTSNIRHKKFPVPKPFREQLSRRRVNPPPSQTPPPLRDSFLCRPSEVLQITGMSYVPKVEHGPDPWGSTDKMLMLASFEEKYKDFM